MSADIPVNL